VLQEGVGNHGYQCVTMNTLPGLRLDVPLSSGWPSFTNFYFTLNGTYSTHYELN
jgi:hypothetical protein